MNGYNPRQHCKSTKPNQHPIHLDYHHQNPQTNLQHPPELAVQLRTTDNSESQKKGDQTMVKVKAPFGGLSASGTIGGAFTFASTKGVQYARAHAVPSNPKTVLQVSTRAMMAFLGARWSELTAAEKATWTAALGGEGASQFNHFVKVNMKRWTQFTYPLIASDQAAGTAPVMGTLTATAGVGQIALSAAITTTNGIWGAAVCMSQTTGFTPARDNLKIVLAGTAGPLTGTITGLVAGSYYVRIAGFNIGGTASAYVAESAELAVT